MQVYIHTFGCQMNMLDSDKMVALLSRAGHVRVDAPEEADVILVNTCSVRAKAVQKLYSLLGRLKDRRDIIVGVTGCVAQHEREALATRFPFIKLVMGPDAIPRIVTLLEEARHAPSVVVDVDFQEGLEYPFVAALPPESGTPVPTAFVTIQKGCDNHCAYCIVPTTRGAEVSRRPEEILAEVAELASRGVREVTLLGQNVNAYGKKAGFGTTFPELLRQVCAIEGIRRVRFTTSHPRDLSPELIAAHAELPELCPHIHLPVQSGSTRILRRMGRGYSREAYLDKVAALRDAVPGMAITTDFIVGYPGETERDFEETIDLLEQVRFDASFSFIFSPRPGTPAARLPDPIPRAEGTRRLIHLQAIQRTISTENNQQQVGTETTVLVDGTSRQGTGDVTGRTPENRTVNLAGSRELIGRFIRVRVTGASVNSLRGEQISS